MGMMGRERAGALLPLHETGAAPRVLVTDLDRLESHGDGLYCFVGTHPLQIAGVMHREVVIYIDCTPWAIAKGIVMSFSVVTELCGVLRKAKELITFH